MLPHPDHRPTGFLEVAVGLAIPFDVESQFGCPPDAVSFGQGAVLRTPVPEAAVDEDDDPMPSELKVGAAARQPRERMVNAVPKASRMKDATNRHFRSGVSSALPRHPRRRCGICYRESPGHLSRVALGTMSI